MLTTTKAPAQALSISLSNQKPTANGGLGDIDYSDALTHVIGFNKSIVVEHSGFEPLTSSLPAKRSSQLS